MGFVQKIYDSNENGFDKRKFYAKCGNFDFKSIIVAKTNQEHVFCFYSSKNVLYNAFIQQQKKRDVKLGFLLSSPITVNRPIWNRKLSFFHFPNNFKVDQKEKFSDLIQKYSDDNNIIEESEYAPS